MSPVDVEDGDDHKCFLEIGKKIAAKCGGLPLAAKLYGNILRFKFDEMEWNAMLNCKLWDLPESENEIFPTLKLIYDHFSPSLKRCFGYCSIFPRQKGSFRRKE